MDKLPRETKGNAIDSDYIEKVNQEGEIGYDLSQLARDAVEVGSCPTVHEHRPTLMRRPALDQTMPSLCR
ncbi:MAG TPA: hypothetical protein VJS67_09780 [Pseudonocardiaceae bacterium]|nr:hypothetical protein [Pseudonocardiaceae bacterium]